jgi:hypothetical protein
MAFVAYEKLKPTYFGFAVSVSCHQCSAFTFKYSLLLQKDKGAKAGNLPKGKALSELEENFIDKYVHFLQGVNSRYPCQQSMLTLHSNTSPTRKKEG